MHLSCTSDLIRIDKPSTSSVLGKSVFCLRLDNLAPVMTSLSEHIINIEP